jgi:hypothetical protein
MFNFLPSYFLMLFVANDDKVAAPAVAPTANPVFKRKYLRDIFFIAVVFILNLHQQNLRNCKII